jgi:hypothetical protein
VILCTVSLDLLCCSAACEMNCSRFRLFSNVTEPVGAGAGEAVSACIILPGTGVCGNTGSDDEDAS